MDEEAGASIIADLAEALKHTRAQPVFLIAANEGRLRAVLGQVDSKQLYQNVDRQLRNGPDDLNDSPLIVLNLNRVTTSVYVPQALDWLTDAVHWAACETCLAADDCPIRFNATRLADSFIGRRLTLLYEILEHLSLHVTIRDMLIHLAYTLTCGLDCKYIIEKSQEPGWEPENHIYYENVWGQWADDTFRRKLLVINYLRTLNVGEDSLFELDDFIINGPSENDKQQMVEYDRLFADALDLGGRRFKQARKTYLHGGASVPKPDEKHALIKWLPHIRRKLFFEWRNSSSDKANRLFPFRFLPGYLELMRNEKNILEHYRKKLILGSDCSLRQPALLRYFYNSQQAAKENERISLSQAVSLRQRVTLEQWEQELKDLHRHFNWVICYDTTIDRFLLEDSFPNTVEVIRYSLGLGPKQRHNLTVSASDRTRKIVVRRLTHRLTDLLHNAPDQFREQVAAHLVDKARQISGDIVLRAAGPGVFLNELIGLIAAKWETERRFLRRHPGALIAWIYLDDFVHWFHAKQPDLLFVAILPEADGGLILHLEVIETKCVGKANFAVEARDAQKQVAAGINRLAAAWQPGDNHLDARYWYDQLYQAVVGNLALETHQMRVWETLRHRLPEGKYTLEMSGHVWAFCYERSSGINGDRQEGENDIKAPDASHLAHRYHHYSRSGLRTLLRQLVEAGDEPITVADPHIWGPDFDPPSEPVVPEPPVLETTAEPLLPISIALEKPAVDEQLPSGIDRSWLEQMGQDVNRVLRDYDIQAFPVDANKADIGPSVIRFKAQLRAGEKLARLQKIAEDLARGLRLESVPLIDNIPGTHFVGIDLPRPEPDIIRLLPALSELPEPEIGQLWYLLGKSPGGQIKVVDLTTPPHLLVAGSTGSGKTIFLYTLAVSLMHQFGPEQLSLLLIDPKQTDFIYFEGLPHLIGGQVLIEPEEAIIALQELTESYLPERTRQLRQARSRDIKDYNRRHPLEVMKPVVVIIDEYADLVQILDKTDRQGFERSLSRLAQRARNVGIHLVIATQRPSADIVTSRLKTNLPARIAFRLPSYHDSMTVLDQPGAEKLIGRGDMLFLRDGNLERLQGFFISPDELEDFLGEYRR